MVSTMISAIDCQPVTGFNNGRFMIVGFALIDKYTDLGKVKKTHFQLS